MSKSCEFCNELGLTRYMDKSKPFWGYEYQAALAKRWWPKEKGKRAAELTLHIKSKKSQMGFKLNYCPECGKKLKHQGKYSVKTDFEKEKTDGKD